MLLNKLNKYGDSNTRARQELGSSHVQTPCQANLTGRGPKVSASQVYLQSARAPPRPVPVGPPSSSPLCTLALTSPEQNRPEFRRTGPPTHLVLVCICVLVAVPDCMSCLLYMPASPYTLSAMWACACGHASRVVICFQALPALCRPPAMPSTIGLISGQTAPPTPIISHWSPAHSCPSGLL